MGKSKLGTKSLLASRHLTRISFVVEPCQMQQAMKRQYFDLNRKRVAALICLPACNRDTDCQISRDLERPALPGGKRKHVRSFVLPPKLPVQSADRCIGGKQHIYLSTQLHRRLCLTQETSEGPRIRNALVPGRVGLSGASGPLSQRFLRGKIGVQIWVEKDHRARG